MVRVGCGGEFGRGFRSGFGGGAVGGATAVSAAVGAEVGFGRMFVCKSDARRRREEDENERQRQKDREIDRQTHIRGGMTWAYKQRDKMKREGEGGITRCIY